MLKRFVVLLFLIGSLPGLAFDPGPFTPAQNGPIPCPIDQPGCDGVSPSNSSYDTCIILCQHIFNHNLNSCNNISNTQSREICKTIARSNFNACKQGC